MPPRAHVSTRRPRRIRRLVLGGALLGLFAMHGMADHGSMHQPISDPTAAHGSMATGQSEPSHGVSVGSAGDHGGEMSELLGLCLAVLGLAVAALLALGAGLIHVRVRGRMLTQPVGVPPRRRDRDPPCLFALSIQRC